MNSKSRATKLLHELRSSGCELIEAGDRLWIKGARALSNEQRRQIAHHRSALTELVRNEHTRHLESWKQLRTLGSQLGETVVVDGELYQLWSVSPSEAVCFNGITFRSVDVRDVEKLGAK